MADVDSSKGKNSIDLRSNDEINTGAQVDASTFVDAKAFGNAIPLRVPFWKAAAIEAKAEQVQNLDNAGMTIKNGPVGQKTREQLQAERDEESADQFRQLIAFVTEEERLREEWMRTKSSIGGVEMTGREWAEFADRLRNDEQLREKIITAFKAQGMSDAEANRRYERVADVSEAMGVPPSERTEEQTSLIEKSKNDPSLTSDMKTAHDAFEMLSAPKADVPQKVSPSLAVAALDGPGF
ncbi:hypothetical protein [Caulobacter soli]|uniref:hypothetical protein n=1 Tax=Caulobacter soli TaxID=2708539 RepID=UPI0013EA277A|nr:hypothetical protein [Caulobacter soli]